MSDKRLQETLKTIQRIAGGDFSARNMLSGQKDEVDALMAGINMLAEELSARFNENERLLAEMKQHIQTITEQNRTILSLSTPTLIISEGILITPIIGSLDTQRALMLGEELMNRVVEAEARVVIIDVTGIVVVDEEVVNHLTQIFDSIGLLGARCILTGLRPEFAQTIVRSGNTLSRVTTAGSLQSGLRMAQEMLSSPIQLQ